MQTAAMPRCNKVRPPYRPMPTAYGYGYECGHSAFFDRSFTRKSPVFSLVPLKCRIRKFPHTHLFIFSSEFECWIPRLASIRSAQRIRGLPLGGRSHGENNARSGGARKRRGGGSSRKGEWVCGERVLWDMQILREYLEQGLRPGLYGAGRGGSGMSGLIWSTREENPPPSTPLSSSATAHTRLCSYSDLIRPSPTSFWTRISSCCREMTHSPYRIFYSRRLRRNR